jgi:murein DD-endopeptidase MepM/ murein hydrolase activator NlpD
MIMIFVIITMLFSIYGILRVTGQDELTNKVNNLTRINNFSMDVIMDLGHDSLINKYPNHQDIINNYFQNLEIMNSLIPPIDGYVTQGIDLINKDYEHTGIDIAAKKGEKIISPYYGLVIFSGKIEDLGNTIILSHPNNIFSLYGHNDKNLVKPRDIVNKGDIIGHIGESGISEGPHLHFEMWKNAEILDPRDFIEIYKKKDISTNETRQPN